jgi:hypothetical protein
MTSPSPASPPSGSVASAGAEPRPYCPGVYFADELMPRWVATHAALLGVARRWAIVWRMYTDDWYRLAEGSCNARDIATRHPERPPAAR